ncbi:valine--tRNA ligase-like, partial [Trifolium medium]|nr:valine--tRNA ligase-like [Trifolium medium]
TASKKSEKKTVKRGSENENPGDYIDPETPLGDKKHMSRQLAKQYNPAAVEKS